jgi:NTE family protein
LTTGLVLGAGGSVGFAYHVGTLSALAESGWDPRKANVIVGTSTGAVTAALLRAGVSPADLYCGLLGRPLSEIGQQVLAEGEHLLTLMANMRKGQPRAGRPASISLLTELAKRPWRIRPGLFLAGLRPVGTVSTESIEAVFDGVFGDDWPLESLWVCAVELDSGRRVIFGHDGGPVADVGTAVAASAAVPSFFEPVVVDGRRFVDGGVHSPVNADVFAGMRLDRVIVSAPMGIGARPNRFGVDLPGRFLNHRTARKELAAIGQAGVETEVFEPGAGELALMHYDSFELDHLPDIAMTARDAALKRLA